MDKKLLYPLPRHSCKPVELSLKNNAHENIGTKKFSITMNFANICNQIFIIKLRKLILDYLYIKQEQYETVIMIIALVLPNLKHELTFGLKWIFFRKIPLKRQL